MPESIESLRRPTLEVVDLPIDQLEPDEVNPNRVAPEVMKALKADIERGFFQPVVVRPEGKRYVIVDGEHRWRTLKALGAKTIPSVIDDADLDDAHLRMLTMNMLRGTPSPSRTAKVLADLAAEMSEEELLERLAMPEEEYASLKAVEAAGEDLDGRIVEALAAEDAKAPEVLRWRMGPRQAERVEKVLGDIAEAEDTSRAEALVKILSAD